MLFSEPQVGIEPTTYSLRENRSATELLRLVMFVEAVGVEPTKAEWQQIYSLPSLTAGAHLNFFLFSCGNNWSRTNFYGFSVRRIDHLCYVSMFFCCLTRTRTSTTMVQNHLHYHYAIRQLLRRVTDSNRMRLHAHFV